MHAQKSLALIIHLPFFSLCFSRREKGTNDMKELFPLKHKELTIETHGDILCVSLSVSRIKQHD
jgi:hypothetical protein